MQLSSSEFSLTISVFVLRFSNLYYGCIAIKMDAYCSVTGLHVVLIMFTGYLVGYAAFRALFGHSPAMVTSGIYFYIFVNPLYDLWLQLIKLLCQELAELTPFSTFLVIEELTFLIFIFQAAAGGILGLVFGMLVETLLFIIRTTSQDRQPSSFTSRIKKDQYFATKLKKDQ